MLLVKLEGQDKSEAKKSAIRDVRDGFAKSNIRFKTFESQDLHLHPVVKLTLAICPYYNTRVRNVEDSNDTLKPFLLKEVGSKAQDVDVYGPWGPERVILLGRTGSGKSTLAQMLTRGKLDLVTEIFPLSSSIRGESMKLKYGQGRVRYVVDKPGFGEPKDKLSTVSKVEIEKQLKKYVQLIDRFYSHFKYVVAKDRIDQLERNLWEFSSQLFGDVIQSYVTVLISSAAQSWVEDNKDHLQFSFKGCRGFVSAQVSLTKTDHNEWEEALPEVRMASLKQLEDELGSLGRIFMSCGHEISSKGHVKDIWLRRVQKHGDITV